MTRNDLKNSISAYVRPMLPGTTTLAEADKAVERIIKVLDAEIQAVKDPEPEPEPIEVRPLPCVGCQHIPIICGHIGAYPCMGFTLTPPPSDGKTPKMCVGCGIYGTNCGFDSEPHPSDCLEFVPF